MQVRRQSFLRLLSVTESFKRFRVQTESTPPRWVVKGWPERCQDLLQTLYDLDNWALTAVVIAAYLLVSSAFVLLLYPAALWDRDGFVGDIPDGLSLLGAMFYLSLGVLSQAPVALSNLEPATPVAVAIIAVEHFVGILMSACLLGVLINKASIPRAQVIFSDALLLTSRDRTPVMIFRIGNIGGNFLLHPDIRISYLRAATTEEGESIVKLSPVDYEAPPSMAPCLNIACHISKGSPLWGKTYKELEAATSSVHIAISATDNRHYQPVYASKMYSIKDVRVNCRFADVLERAEDGQRIVNFAGFNSLIENDNMPVTYGLTREETAHINGPDVQRPFQLERQLSATDVHACAFTSDVATAPQAPDQDASDQPLNVTGVPSKGDATVEDDASPTKSFIANLSGTHVDQHRDGNRSPTHDAKTPSSGDKKYV